LDTFEIRDKEINVEEIMQKIRENIKRRKEGGADLNMANEDICQESNHVVHDNNFLDIIKKIQNDIDLINSKWNIQNKNYVISSNRLIAGKALIKSRKLVHDEVKRYVDPIILQQTDFNASVVRVLNEEIKSIAKIVGNIKEIKCSIEQLQDNLMVQIEEIKSHTEKRIHSEMEDKLSELAVEIGDTQSILSTKIDDKISELAVEIEDRQSILSTKIDDKISELAVEINASYNKAKISQEVTEKIEAVIATIDTDIKNKAWLAGILNNRIANDKDIPLESVVPQDMGMNYFVFEEKFRGSRADIKTRQVEFLKYFKGCTNVLDIGCGRGEFLELIKENDIGGHGIDIDEDMAKFCKSKGLSVDRIDALSYLTNIEDKSLDGIFIDQVVEHLETNYLIKLLDICYKKLIHGSVLVVETINPLTLAALMNFYMDLSHKRPIHPETLEFLFISVGFREIERRFFSPVPEEARLKRIITTNNSINKNDIIYNEIFNSNVDMLNNALFGAQDYAIIGKK
jgi:O-antigen chain-terminating methyltransferase